MIENSNEKYSRLCNLGLNKIVQYICKQCIYGIYQSKNYIITIRIINANV